MGSEIFFHFSSVCKFNKLIHQLKQKEHIDYQLD